MKINLMNIVDTLLLLLIIIKTNSIYLYIGVENKLNFYLIVVITIAVLFEVISGRLSLQYLKKMLLVIVLYFFAIIINILVSASVISSNILTYYFIVVPLMLILVMYKYYKKTLTNFLAIFVRIVLILAVISLLFWCFGSVLNIIKPTNYVVSSWSGGQVTTSYYNLYFETQNTLFLGYKMIRNSGIFAEAPMWSLLLSVALIFQELLLKHSTRIFVLLMLTILTTASTTGFFIAGSLLIYKVINQKRSWFKYINLTSIPVLIFTLVKVWGEKSDSASASIRYDDYVAGFLAWKNHFIFGSGLSSGIRAIESYMDTTIRSNLGYSNSFFVILAQGGIILGMLYFYPVVSVLLKRFSSNAKMLALLFIILIFTAIFTDTPLFILFVGIFYALILNRENT